MKVLVACEFSGVVREAFKKRGHDAWSCDLLPTEIPGQHIQDDVLKHLDDGWDLMIAHPPCTRRCNSSVRWLKNDEYGTGRWKLLEQDDIFFNTLWYVDIPRICLENPIPHKYTSVVDYSQIIQPWMFGHTERKATCLWLKGLPKLKETNNVKVEMLKLPKAQQQRIHYLSPSPKRAHERSRTYQGIANAFAEQWS
ncbi:MAG: hypothetical protein PHH85_09005 [Candidatus Methanoperedens sp.]|nr:hypothetical protein [Candidatus Methanoperedens sp.]